MKPFFSIIVPVYQSKATLECCVQSVLTQEYEDFELILVDDGSRDNSGAICDRLAQADERIQVIHQENAGVSTARNAGIRLAQGEYLLFLDSDDALLPHALSRYAQATLQSTMDVVIAGISVWENGREVRTIGMETDIQANSEIWENICRDPAPFGYAGGKVIRRSLVSVNAIAFNPNMQSQEDLDFFLSVYGASETFHIISDCLYVYCYAPSKRTPPIGDHLGNQIKLLRTAKKRHALSFDAEQAVYSRVQSMLYTALYCAVEGERYSETVDALRSVEGLGELLKAAQAKDEHGLIARNFAAARYTCIKLYFMLRHAIRDKVRSIKKR